ncbi:MAG: preprotein translocase subunit SecY [Candidatus Gracilibacteria bacterium]|jgi:preprotein translocase subunit SecY|nr:preprotein translocase subunit SecY [Candidatus Gracilibacteria bacterium]
MFNYLKQIWASKSLRNKILFTVGILVIYRMLAHITVPGASIEALSQLNNSSEILQIFSLLTGGGTENFSIILMGLSPYINASIIIQLLTVVIPKFEELSKEGEQGRRKLNQYTRWLTFPLAFMQSYAMILLLTSQVKVPIISDISNPGIVLPIMLTITAGTVLLIWLGELISEHGIGNGISMIIFASIVTNIPALVGQTLILAQQDETKLIPFIFTALITVILLIVVVLVTEGERRIPLTYAGRGAQKGQQAYLPMKVNQVGMIPIIFAVALVTFPGILGQFMQAAKSESVRAIGESLTSLFSAGTILYLVTFFLLIFGFTYFYVSITFNPKQVSENIQKRGGYIPGIRPGEQTEKYLHQTSRRLTFFGGLFIAFIGVSPMLIQLFFDTSSMGSVPLLISGAGLLIIVGVVLELIRQINAQLVMHDYKKFY